MASLIAILDLKGKPLIQRSYRDDVPSSYIERFLPLILELEEQDKLVTPCFTDQGINYMHIRHSNLYCRFHLSFGIDRESILRGGRLRGEGQRLDPRIMFMMLRCTSFQMRQHVSVLYTLSNEPRSQKCNSIKVPRAGLSDD